MRDVLGVKSGGWTRASLRHADCRDGNIRGAGPEEALDCIVDSETLAQKHLQASLPCVSLCDRICSDEPNCSGITYQIGAPAKEISAQVRVAIRFWNLLKPPLVFGTYLARDERAAHERRVPNKGINPGSASTSVSAERIRPTVPKDLGKLCHPVEDGNVVAGLGSEVVQLGWRLSASSQPRNCGIE